MSIDKAIEALTHGARVWDALEALKEAKADRDRLAAEVERLRDELCLCCELKRGYQEQIGELAAEVEALRADAERYRWLAAHCRSTSEHWGGRWSIIVEGPAPKTHDSEDDFDAAIDAAKAKGAA